MFSALPIHPDHAGALSFQLQMRDRTSDRVAQLTRRVLFPTTADCEKLPGSAQLWPLVFAWRPMRLAARTLMRSRR